ncbi:YegS/Rv2252/BmrU family lipid kinase [Oceanirhabdus sp. W0125-5]|uniref:YegS/Rv2252/BmrU family lipid kinase n=1 Tax=Oceanirhabdus sp. W0125-5 TaxID=2999116 RepID=UPI0022F32B7C|nr:YegS/Rv2252/BmrU family lipid kinase [Oceanirhabdus sp. W0125-5]WBW98787.1 YegS/Rv2252/BmrU family lipid kinase [Oceanirhabdus sp. W0125-5]
MKKILFVYNPFSGERIILNYLDKIIELHEKSGYSVHIKRIERTEELQKFFESVEENYEYILVSGGDGSIDIVVNAMKKSNIDMPIGIIPTGTANDFAKFLNIPLDIVKACKQVIEGTEFKVDLGKANDQYFVNVASMGLFTDVSQKTDTTIKNTIGKLAYYIKGIEEIPNLRKLKVKLKWDKGEFDDYIYLLLVLNGKTAGNINLAYKAELDDGKLDVLVFKATRVIQILNICYKLIKGEHLEENIEGLTYFKCDNLHIECEEGIVTDIDGEKGPDFPLEIKCINKGLTLRGKALKDN